jgi:hypothetical protein
VWFAIVNYCISKSAFRALLKSSKKFRFFYISTAGNPMTLRDILSIGMLPQSIGIVGVLVTSKPAQAEPAPISSGQRAEDKRGFTIAPAASDPIFPQRVFQRFEMHRAADSWKFPLDFGAGLVWWLFSANW